jgi:hypothetical protein
MFLTSNGGIHHTLSVLLCKLPSPFSKVSSLPPPLPPPAEEASDQEQAARRVFLTGHREYVIWRRHRPRDGVMTSPLAPPPGLAPKPNERR